MKEKVSNTGKEFINFESINLHRADDISERYWKRKYGVTRAEIVLTNRCQLKCSYCQKHLTYNDFEKSIDHEVLFSTLSQWLNNGCDFLHFTGGEVTLCDNLPLYVELAAKSGAEVTMSSNGVNDISIYDDLVRKGVNTFHISLDTYKANDFDAQVGVPGSFEKVIKTIKHIIKLRDEEHYKTGLVLNVCITPMTFHDIIEIATFMLSLKPNDIKLIPISQLKDEWSEYEKIYESEYKPRLLEMIPQGEGFTMFRSRINSLVKKSFRGYNDKRTVPPCYLSQDERTIDPEGNYYGCYINYREGAKPIGNIQTDSFTIQSEKLRRNMMNFTNSEICQRYCADLTVLCNKYINDKVLENDLSIYYLSGDVNVTSAEFGNKAYMLERLFEEGINVPYSMYLRGQWLEKIFIDDKIEELKKATDKLNEYLKRDGIVQWILGQEKNDELVFLCENFIKRCDSKKFVVRSSSNLEDSSEKSYAGIFDTILNLTNAEEIADSIRKVFLSKYTYLIENPNKVMMGVVVQEQIEADYSGVAFSINPINGDDEIVINYAMGACEQVVSGENAQEIIIEKEGEISKTDPLDKTILIELRNNIILIEKMLDVHVDVEWAVSNNKLYIFQARKITSATKKERISKENIYIDSMEKERLDSIELGDMKNAHRQYMEKHYHIRKKAFEVGIKFPEVGYLFYNSEIITEQIFKDLVPKALVYKVVSGNLIRTLKASDVVPFLISLGKEDGVARIQEVTLTNACGSVTQTASENYYIEYIPGGFGGFIVGELPYSYYLVDQYGKMLENSELEYDHYWVFSEEEKRFVDTPCEKKVFSLTNNVIKQLIEIIKKCELVFENPRIEWELEQENAYLNDISFENSDVDDLLLSQKQISPGSIKGEIRVIDDFDEIKQILKNRSVVAESTFYAAARSNLFDDFLKRHDIQKEKKYIFVCPYAYPSFALFVDYSCGFIFEKGGMLSHLAIILRENGIPAIVEEEALKKYKDGMIL